MSTGSTPAFVFARVFAATPLGWLLLAKSGSREGWLPAGGDCCSDIVDIVLIVGDADSIHTGNLGFLLAQASQRWNERLADRFAAHGFAEVRPSYGSVLLPLFEEDGLRMARSRSDPGCPSRP